MTDVKFIEMDENLYLSTTTNRRNDGCLSNIDDNTFDQYSTRYELNEEGIFKQHSNINTTGAIHVDHQKSNGDVLILITNTFDSLTSACNGQSLYFMNSTTLPVKITEIPNCNVRKSIILSITDKIVTMAILSMDRTVEIYKVFISNSTSTQTQVISTYETSDVVHVVTDLGTFLIISNTYDSSEDALAVSFDVPVTIYR